MVASAVAVALAIQLFGAALERRRARLNMVAIADYVELLSFARGVALPTERSPSSSRSNRGERSLSATARATRIGAYMADLKIVGRARNSLAVRAYVEHDSAAILAVERHSVRVEALAHDLASMLDEVPSGARGARLYRLIEQEGRDKATVDPSVLDAAQGAALQSLPRHVALGNWLEASRVAALRGDTAFLNSPECRAEAEVSLSLSGLSTVERTQLAHVRDMIVTGSDAYTLESLARALTEALSNLTE